MPKAVISVWVKNVHNLSTRPWITGVRFSPTFNNSLHVATRSSNKSLVVRLFVPAFYPLLSTSFFSRFNLLYDWLYTQSTAPTIKKKKKI